MLFLTGCHPALVSPPLDELDWEARSAVDRGSICVLVAGEDPMSVNQDPPPAQTFTAGVPLLAVHGLYFNADCDRAVKLSLEADGLNFTAVAEWEEVVPVEGLFCPDVGEGYYATLELAPLPEGEHTMTFAGETLTLQVPGTQRACLGAYPFGTLR